MKVRSHSVWVGGAVAALASLWVAPTYAAPSRTALVVTADKSCAADTALTLLRDEIRVRLPADVELAGAGDDTAGYWTLTWNPSADGKCALELRDIEPIVTLALPMNSEPDQVREAAVRVAWFVSTTQPQAPPVPVSLEPALSHAYAGVGLGVEDAQLEVLRASASLTDPARVIVKPEPAPAVDPTSMVAEMSATLDAWRTSSPGLFSRRDALLAEEPWVWNVNGVDVPVELHASVFVDAISVDGEGAFFGGVGASVQLARRIGLGVSYRRLMNEVSSSKPSPEVPTGEPDEPSFFETSGLDDAHLFALQLDYTLWDAEPWAVGVNLELGGGVFEERLGSPRFENTTRGVVMAQVGARASYAVLPWMHLGLNLGYRGMLGLGSQQYTPDELSGFTGMMLIRLDLL